VLTTLSSLGAAIPSAVYWAVGAISIAAGLLSILGADRLVRCLRWWLIRQLRWIRSPRYRKMLKIQGWLLFTLGTLMLVLLAIRPS
jgi:hypothetical protein